jgi:hypothetical protein
MRVVAGASSHRHRLDIDHRHVGPHQLGCSSDNQLVSVTVSISLTRINHPRLWEHLGSMARDRWANYVTEVRAVDDRRLCVLRQRP